MSTNIQPELAVTVTSGAATEVKRFMDAEGVSPDVGGLRVSVQPGGCNPQFFRVRTLSDVDLDGRTSWVIDDR